MSLKSSPQATPRTLSSRTQEFAVVTAGFGQNFVLTTVTTFILLYLTSYSHFSGVGIAVATGIIGVAKVIDAITDPIVGSIIDRTRTRWGKMRPWILFSALPVAILSGLLFSVPNTAESNKLVFFGVCYLLWGVAYSACDVPFWGLIGSAFGDSTSRTRVVSKVRAFQAIGLGLATLGLPLLAAALSFSKTDTGQGWSIAVFITAFVGMGIYLLAFFLTREKAIERAPEKLTFRQLFATLFKNTPLLMVVLGSILGFGRNIVQVGGAVFAKMAYGDAKYFTIIGAAIIGGIVIAAFLTPLVLRRTSSRKLVIWSSLAGAVLYVIMFFAGYQNLVTMVVFIFLTGLTLGIFLVVQTTLIADSVDDVEARTGVRNDGISFAMLTFVSKIMVAVATLAFGIAIVVAGYHEGVHVTKQMTETAWVTLTLVPAISCVLSVIPFWFYRLGGRTPDEPLQPSRASASR
jgi:sugar (glycoside-pentoside-hexuronide) transporter